MAPSKGSIAVQVACATPTGQVILDIRVAANSTLAQAVDASGILRRCPELDLSRLKVGIFGRVVSLETQLCAGDRVELYRPLRVDPKVARSRRAQPNPPISQRPTDPLGPA